MLKLLNSFQQIKKGLNQLQRYSNVQQELIQKKEEFTFDEYMNKKGRIFVKDLQDLNFPFKFKGMQDLLPIKKSFDDLILNQSKDLKSINNHLMEQAKHFILALAGERNDFPLMESNFQLKVQEILCILQQNKYTIKLQENNQQFKQRFSEEIFQIIEISHLKGLYVERGQNFPIENYTIEKKYEQQGLIFFTPYHINIKDSKKSEDFNRKQKKQFILRVHAKIYSPLCLNVFNQSQEKQSADPINYIHTCIFENQLRLPPSFSCLSKNEIDTLKEYRLNKWVLVDWDSTMQGNPHVYRESEKRQLVTNSEYKF